MIGHKMQVREHRHIFLRRELEAVLRSRKPGETLPSYTEMIRTYGVGQSTIDRVLRDFETSGLITRQAGKGIFVSPRASKKTAGLFPRTILKSI
jgi:DNA-binding GntR family transcriptional regulator